MTAGTPIPVRMEPNPAEPVFEPAPEPHLELLPALDEPKDGEEEAEEVEAEEADDAEDAPAASRRRRRIRSSSTCARSATAAC